MKVSQEPVKITDVLKDKSFTIPLYQREYSWNLEQVSDLFYDILDLERGSGHFLGSLLLYNDKSLNKLEIVDGQQRMTTVFLLLFCLFKILEDTDKTRVKDRINSLLFIVDPNDLSDDVSFSEPRMETGKRDRKLFKSIIKGEEYDLYKDGRRKSHKNLINTLEFFNDKLIEIKNEYGIAGLIDFTQKVITSEFIVMTAEEQSDKLLLFKTINARGLELTQGDLIKNELCHHLDDLDMDEAIDSWDEMRGRIEKNGGKLDIFLFHYINSLDSSQRNRQILDKKRGLPKWEKKNYPPVPEKYVFDIFSLVIKEEGPRLFLENILKSSDSYANLINPCKENIYLNSLKSMGVNKCFPLLLNSERKINSQNFKDICKNIDSLTFRHSILRNDPKELERFYYQLTELIIDDSKVIEAVQKIKNHNNFKEEEKFKNEFIQASPKGSIARMILDRITRKHAESIDWLYVAFEKVPPVAFEKYPL